MVRSREPEEEGEHSGLDAERHQQKGREECAELGIFQFVDAEREIRHVERAHGAVDQANRDEKEHRGEQVQRDILNRPFELAPLATEREQHKGRQEHQLEPDIEIEDVAGQERAAHRGEKRHREWVMPVGSAESIAGADRIEHDGKAHDGAEQHHDGCEQVGHEGDAERGWPARKEQGDDFTAAGTDEQGDRDGEIDPRCRDADRRLRNRAAPEQQADCCGEHRDEYRQRDQHGLRSVEVMVSRSSVPTAS